MKEIQTNGKTLLFVEVPQDAKKFEIRTPIFGDLFYTTWQNDIGIGKSNLPYGNCQILGKSTELSEEQMKEICESIFDKNYFDYVNQNKGSYAPGFVFDTVQESYISLLEANGIVDRNLYGDYEPDYISVPLSWDSEGFDSDLKKYREAQSKVKHYLVLEKI